MVTAVGQLLCDGQPSQPQALLERARRPGRSAGPLARDALSKEFTGDNMPCYDNGIEYDLTAVPIETALSHGVPMQLVRRRAAELRAKWDDMRVMDVGIGSWHKPAEVFAMCRCHRSCGQVP